MGLEPTDMLRGVPRTLLIPLLSRAEARTRFPELAFADPIAEELLPRIDFEADAIRGDLLTMRGCAARAKSFDAVARSFFERHPDGLGVSLGAGLCTRFHRIDNGTLAWVDLDLPDVVALKQRLLPEAERYRIMSGSVTDHAWLERIGWQAGRPLFVVSEGLLVYLEPSEVRSLLMAMADRFDTGCEILFDYCNPWMVRGQRLFHSIHQSGARLRWGSWSGREFARWHPRLRHLSDFGPTLDAGGIASALSWTFRLASFGHHFYGACHLRIEPTSSSTVATTSPIGSRVSIT